MFESIFFKNRIARSIIFFSMLLSLQILTIAIASDDIKKSLYFVDTDGILASEYKKRRSRIESFKNRYKEEHIQDIDRLIVIAEGNTYRLSLKVDKLKKELENFHTDPYSLAALDGFNQSVDVHLNHYEERLDRKIDEVRYLKAAKALGGFQKTEEMEQSLKADILAHYKDIVENSTWFYGEKVAAVFQQGDLYRDPVKYMSPEDFNGVVYYDSHGVSGAHDEGAAVVAEKIVNKILKGNKDFIAKTKKIVFASCDLSGDYVNEFMFELSTKIGKHIADKDIEIEVVYPKEKINYLYSYENGRPYVSHWLMLDNAIKPSAVTQYLQKNLRITARENSPFHRTRIVIKKPDDRFSIFNKTYKNNFSIEYETGQELYKQGFRLKNKSGSVGPADPSNIGYLMKLGRSNDFNEITHPRLESGSKKRTPQGLSGETVELQGNLSDILTARNKKLTPNGYNPSESSNFILDDSFIDHAKNGLKADLERRLANFLPDADYDNKNNHAVKSEGRLVKSETVDGKQYYVTNDANEFAVKHIFEGNRYKYFITKYRRSESGPKKHELANDLNFITKKMIEVAPGSNPNLSSVRAEHGEKGTVRIHFTTEESAIEHTIEFNEKELHTPAALNRMSLASRVNYGLAVHGTIVGAMQAIASFENGDETTGAILMSQSVHGLGQLTGVNARIVGAAQRGFAKAMQPTVAALKASTEEASTRLAAKVALKMGTTVSHGAELLTRMPVIGVAFGVFNIVEDLERGGTLGKIDAALDAATLAASLAGPEGEVLAIGLTIFRLGFDSYYLEIDAALHEFGCVGDNTDGCNFGETMEAIGKGLLYGTRDIWETFTLGGQIEHAIRASKELDKIADRDDKFEAELKQGKNLFSENNGYVEFTTADSIWVGDIDFTLGEPLNDGSGKLAPSILSYEADDHKYNSRVHTDAQNIVMSLGEEVEFKHKTEKAKFLFFIPVHSRHVIDWENNVALYDSEYGRYTGNSQDNVFFALQGAHPFDTKGLPANFESDPGMYHYQLRGMAGNDTFLVGEQVTSIDGGPGSDTVVIDDFKSSVTINYDAASSAPDDVEYVSLPMDYGHIHAYYNDSQERLSMHVASFLHHNEHFSDESYKARMFFSLHINGYKCVEGQCSPFFFKTKDGYTFEISGDDESYETGRKLVSVDLSLGLTGVDSRTFIPRDLHFPYATHAPTTVTASPYGGNIDIATSRLTFIPSCPDAPEGVDQTKDCRARTQGSQFNIAGSPGADTLYTLPFGDYRFTLSDENKVVDNIIIPLPYSSLVLHQYGNNLQIMSDTRSDYSVLINDFYSDKNVRHILVHTQDGVAFTLELDDDTQTAVKAPISVRFEKQSERYAKVTTSNTFLDGQTVDNTQQILGAQTIYGTQNYENLIQGNELDNTFIGGDAGNKLYGDEGADRLSGGAGVDYLYGGLGNDTLTGYNGNDRLYGNEGDDVFDPGPGMNYIQGDEGYDWLLTTGNAGTRSGIAAVLNDSTYASAGSYYLRSNGSNLTNIFYGIEAISGTPFDDAIAIYDTNNETTYRFEGGHGADRMTTFHGSLHLAGGDGADEYVIYFQKGRPGERYIDNFSVLDTGRDGGTPVYDRLRLASADARKLRFAVENLDLVIWVPGQENHRVRVNYYYLDEAFRHLIFIDMNGNRITIPDFKEVASAMYLADFMVEKGWETQNSVTGLTHQQLRDFAIKHLVAGSASDAKSLSTASMNDLVEYARAQTLMPLSDVYNRDVIESLTVEQQHELFENFASHYYFSFVNTSVPHSKYFNVITTSDGGYLAAGKAWDTDEASAELLLTRLNRFGQILWHKTFTHPETILSKQGNNTFSLVELSDATYAVGTVAGLYLVNQNGTLLNQDWTEVLSHVRGVLETDNGNLIVASGHPSTGSFIRQYTPSGSRVWGQEWSWTTIPVGLVKTDDGGFTVLFRLETSYTQLVHFNSKGTPLWSKRYRLDHNGRKPTDLAITEKGDYIVSGMRFGVPWYMTVDSDGNMLRESHDFAASSSLPNTFTSVVKHNDGGFTFMQNTESEQDQRLLVKINNAGLVESKIALEGIYGDSNLDEKALWLSTEGDYLVAGFNAQQQGVVRLVSPQGQMWPEFPAKNEPGSVAQNAAH